MSNAKPSTWLGIAILMFLFGWAVVPRFGTSVQTVYDNMVGIHKVSIHLERYEVPERIRMVNDIKARENNIHSQSKRSRDLKNDPVDNDKDLKSHKEQPKIIEKGNICNQEARQKLLQETCKWGKTQGVVDYEDWRFKDVTQFQNLFVDDTHRVIYCEVPKVACTSFKAFFANLTGKVKPQEMPRLHDLVHDTTFYKRVGFRYLMDYTYDERMYRIKNYYKFLVVRNPYTRLISAYKDKFVQDTYHSWWYHTNIGTHIIKRYRERPSNTSLREGKDVRLEEFVQFVSDQTDHLKERLDFHWWRVQGICHPCLIQYDYIAKLETLEQDLVQILHNILPGQNVKFPYLNLNSVQDLKKTEEHFRNLSKDALNMFYEFYGIDLKLFGYSMYENDKECL